MANNPLINGNNIHPDELISFGRTTLATVLHSLLSARLISNAPLNNSNPTLGALILFGIKNTWQAKMVPPELEPLFNKELPASGELDWETVCKVTGLPSVQPILDDILARYPALKPSVRLARKLKLLSKFSGTDLRPEAFDSYVIDALYGVEDHLMGTIDSIAALRDELKREIKAVKKAIQAGKATESGSSDEQGLDEPGIVTVDSNSDQPAGELYRAALRGELKREITDVKKAIQASKATDTGKHASSSSKEQKEPNAITVDIIQPKSEPEKFTTEAKATLLPEHEDNDDDGLMSSFKSGIKKRKADEPPKADFGGKKFKLHQQH